MVVTTDTTMVFQFSLKKSRTMCTPPPLFARCRFPICCHKVRFCGLPPAARAFLRWAINQAALWRIGRLDVYRGISLYKQNLLPRPPREKWPLPGSCRHSFMDVQRVHLLVLPSFPCYNEPGRRCFA